MPRKKPNPDLTELLESSQSNHPLLQNLLFYIYVIGKLLLAPRFIDTGLDKCMLIFRLFYYLSDTYS